MKCVLLSVKPRFVADILNGTKTLEVRKRFPKNYRGWVYIYCTKEDNLFKSYIRMGYYTTRSTADDLSYNGKGKVIARFYVNNVEEIKYQKEETEDSKLFNKLTCLSNEELDNYLQGKNGYAIHISQLEIFDEPKELSEFRNKNYNPDKVSDEIDEMVREEVIDFHLGIRFTGVVRSYDEFKIRDECCRTVEQKYRLTKAPQSWQYIEIGD